MADRVLVTGAGVVSACGVGVEAVWQSLLRGESHVGRIRHLDTEHREIPVGEVALSNAEMADMLGVGYPHSGLRSVLLGIVAAREALQSSELDSSCLRNAAFVNGTTVGGMDKTERYFKTVLDTNCETDDCLEMYNDCGMITDLVADSLGQFSIVTTTSTACSSAANAMMLGADLIKAGFVDVAVVGGCEALTRFHLNGFNALMILDTEICKPFERDRKGINLGEGAAYIVLESEKSVLRRHASVLAELAGYANACDAFHQTASSANGEGAYLSMKKAIEMAGLCPQQIDYVNAHGTGTPNNDASELAAIGRIWGDRYPKVSSTKPLTGHTTSASGAIEAVICLLAINRGLVPKNYGWANPMKSGFTPVLENLTGQKIEHVIDNSFGFGGNDSSIVFSKYTLGDEK